MAHGPHHLRQARVESRVQRSRQLRVTPLELEDRGYSWIDEKAGAAPAGGAEGVQ